MSTIERGRLEIEEIAKAFDLAWSVTIDPISEIVVVEHRLRGVGFFVSRESIRDDRHLREAAKALLTNHVGPMTERREALDAAERARDEAAAQALLYPACARIAAPTSLHGVSLTDAPFHVTEHVMGLRELRAASDGQPSRDAAPAPCPTALTLGALQRQHGGPQ